MFIKETAIGKICISEQDGHITQVCFGPDAFPGDQELRETPLIKQAFEQLELYLQGQLKEFTLPLKPEGTPFMKNVWHKLCEVPYGATASYKAIAEAAGKPGAARAVGMACNRNPIAIIIPCHRVIGSGGDLVGFGGGLDLKRKLLQLEAEVIGKSLNNL